MACLVAFNSSSIYNSGKARNFFKRFLRQSRNPSYSPRTAVPSLYPVLDFRPINPRREPICLNIRKISSYCTRAPHNLKNCITSSSSSKTSIFAKDFSGTVTDPLSSGPKMTVAAAPCIKDGSLMANGKVVLTGVPSNVAVYPVTDGLSSSSSPSAAFLGASSSIPSSRHVFGLGVLEECKFVCLFRHKIWWMIPRFGSSGSDIPMETQLLLLEVRENFAVCDDISSGQSAANTFYILLLPVLEGQFRATLQGTKASELEFCVESGDAHVQTTQVSEAVFINSGDNPFKLIKESFEILEKQKRTFAHIKHKKKPTHLDWFGWCTWDAFYKDVNPRGIKEGLESFLEGGCPPKFLIIDDGWQDTFNEFQKDGEPFVEGSQFASRLVDLRESSKFMGSGAELSCHDLHDLVKFIKEKYGVKFVYVWHALVGYWGGILQSSEKMKNYNPKITYPVQSPGNVGNLRDIAMDSLEKYGVGLIDPEKVYDFYNDLHSYLSSSGVDGIKVDVQNLIETLGGGHGGRVSLTRKYQEALEESVARNFKENNLICCMSHNTDSIYSSRRSATARASEDFMPWEPTFQTLHVASVAFNSLLLGEIVVPDWDMFQSDHYTAEFHGAARALGGCAVYVSDKPGMHDFKILKKLVLPDGSVLRAKYAGRPTRDCLFLDTVMDGKSLLKIWNLNKLSGVVGVFNCQGAGNWPLRDGPERNPSSSSDSLILSGHVSPQDVDFLDEVAHETWSGDCAVYAFHTGSLSRLSKEENVKVSLATLECEIFTVSPIRVINETLHFAPIGLIDMYNSGGATEGLSSAVEPSACTITIQARGCGRFGAYSSKKPISCTVDGKNEEFVYCPDDGLLIVKLEGECKSRDINFCY
ncbi:probable galactinol--sucrose galactosyltransferase 2 [Sesamum indicum]|uniref:galactinol--sucrose galactosyltransferase n=1 Tax=Sesamum indicum TaxID=4182 RepID=A0A6I9SPD6_SESIN|nr:probable galactinol--sucrose galactosyltransferase 2 [Sesamum indicum]